MIYIVAFLLIVGLVARHKWRNAAAKQEEILRLVAITSEEEAEIAKIQYVEDFSPHPVVHPVSVAVPVQPKTPPRLEKQRYHCAVCYSPTTTRCSQCKAVRYCSGKCQIIHWRQGHKDECRPGIPLQGGKESEYVTETVQNQFEMHMNREAKMSLDQEPDDSGSSSNSLPFFSSSTEHSETSFDASTSEVLDIGTPIKQDLAHSIGDNSPLSRTSDYDNVDVQDTSPFASTVYPANNKVRPSKMKKTRSSKADEEFELSISKDKRNNSVDTVLDEVEAGRTEFRSYQPSSSVRTPEADSWNTEGSLLPNRGVRSVSVRGSGSHQFSNIEMRRSSQCSKSLKNSKLDECGKNGAQACNGKETRSVSVRNTSNDHKISGQAESPQALPSEIEAVRMLSQATSKGLKTSVRKFVHHFRAPRPSKNTLDTAKDSGENYSHKVIFPLKLFTQLYSCDSIVIQPFGLANCGNSCYANAVLQCLTFTRPFTSYLLQGFHTNSCRKRDLCFICEFERLIRKGQETSFPLSPVKMMSQIPMFGSHINHGREEDAHEFLRNVVDKMQSICLEEAGVSGSWAEESTLVGLTFGGSLRSKVECMKCFERSETSDRMMDLTVEIDGNTYTLEDALAQFTTSEILGGDDKYKCSRCKSYQKAKKKLKVLEAPNILTVVLKRFQSGNFEKLNKLVRFPEVLNLTPYMSGRIDKYPTYHLYAVVVHLGTSAAYSGHYVSYVKDFRGDWFRIDDSRVSPVDLETVLSVEAYILFYARETPRVGSMMSSGYSDGKIKRSTEAISSSNSTKKKNSKAKPGSSQSTDCTMLHQRSEKHYWVSPNDFVSNHVVDPEGFTVHRKHRNVILDSSSDCSSIFSTSDAGSYSTDSTKDSSAEDISGYLFGSSWLQP